MSTSKVNMLIKLHANGCKDKWLRHHPRKFHEGGKATVIRHSLYDGRILDEMPVREWRTTPELSWYSGQCVWIYVLRPRFRSGANLDGCHDPGFPYFITIEHDGAVLYDSRWDVPYDPNFERGDERRLQEAP